MFSFVGVWVSRAPLILRERVRERESLWEAGCVFLRVCLCMCVYVRHCELVGGWRVQKIVRVSVCFCVSERYSCERACVSIDCFFVHNLVVRDYTCAYREICTVLIFVLLYILVTFVCILCFNEPGGLSVAGGWKAHVSHVLGVACRLRGYQCVDRIHESHCVTYGITTIFTHCV